MTIPNSFLCDGCGQPASTEHIAQRLQRLEWTTRYRPVHIRTLLLGASSPTDPQEFLYSPNDRFSGEALQLLEAAGLSIAGKTAGTLHSEFQRLGLLLTHVLECPLEPQQGPAVPGAILQSLLAQRAAVAATRIRRSLKPKRVVLISPALAPFMERFSPGELGCAVTLDGDLPFALDDPSARSRLRESFAK
jgi:hypothetical protein